MSTLTDDELLGAATGLRWYASLIMGALPRLYWRFHKPPLNMCTESRHWWLAGWSDARSEHLQLQSQPAGGWVFYQGVGLIWCPDCGGWQSISKPVK